MQPAYQMIGADGLEYGPVSQEELCRWVKEGRVVGGTRVRRAGDETWSTAASFSELGLADQVGAPAVASTTTESMEDPADLAELAKKMKSSGSWFFWIAALTLVNTVVAFSGKDWGFVLGLTVTQLIDAVVIKVTPEEFSMTAKFVAAAVDIVAVGLFVFLGVMACRRQMWAFAVGVVVYGLDTLLTLLSFSIVSIGIHGWALFAIFMGLKAAQEWKKLDPNQSLAVPAGA